MSGSCSFDSLSGHRSIEAPMCGRANDQTPRQKSRDSSEVRPSHALASRMGAVRKRRDDSRQRLAVAPSSTADRGGTVRLSADGGRHISSSSAARGIADGSEAPTLRRRSAEDRGARPLTLELPARATVHLGRSSSLRRTAFVFHPALADRAQALPARAERRVVDEDEVDPSCSDGSPHTPGHSEVARRRRPPSAREQARTLARARGGHVARPSSSELFGDRLVRIPE